VSAGSRSDQKLVYAVVVHQPSVGRLQAVGDLECNAGATLARMCRVMLELEGLVGDFIEGRTCLPVFEKLSRYYEGQKH
jgi:hypothetical protein